MPLLKASGLQMLMTPWSVNQEMALACNSGLRRGCSTQAGSCASPDSVHPLPLRSLLRLQKPASCDEARPCGLTPNSFRGRRFPDVHQLGPRQHVPGVGCAIHILWFGIDLRNQFQQVRLVLRELGLQFLDVLDLSL